MLASAGIIDGQLDAGGAGRKADTGPDGGKLGYVNPRLSYSSWSEATSHVPHRRGRRRPRGIGSKAEQSVEAGPGSAVGAAALFVLHKGE